MLAAAAAAGGALLLDVTEIDRHHLTVTEHAVPIAELPTAFHGFRIVQISDFHYMDFDEDRFLRRVVARVNELKPDMVALTGDFITSNSNWRKNVPHARACAEVLGGIQCALRFCSLGNHDSADIPAVTAALTANGMQVLHNARTAVDVRGDRLWVGGLADAYYEAPNLVEAIPKLTKKAPMVLLGHEPDVADAVAAYGGVDLMLAGHSHGGQVRIPGLTAMFLPDLGRKYVHGAFALDKLQLYVNRGIGTVHLPLRFRCPPEITVLTLQPA